MPHISDGFAQLFLKGFSHAGHVACATPTLVLQQTALECLGAHSGGRHPFW